MSPFYNVDFLTKMMGDGKKEDQKLNEDNDNARPWNKKLVLFLVVMKKGP